MVRSKQFNIRFRLDNPIDQEVFKVLDNLNLSIHKSKNRFVITALYDYINGYGAEYLEKQAKRENYITVEEYEKKRAEDREQIRNEVYQDLIRFLATVNVSRTVAEIQSEKQTGSYTAGTNPMPNNEPQAELPSAMMDDIMKWS